MRPETEIVDRLAELHGINCPAEMGGQMPLAEAKALLWALGHDDPSVRWEPRVNSAHVDVSEYIDVEPLEDDRR